MWGMFNTQEGYPSITLDYPCLHMPLSFSIYPYLLIVQPLIKDFSNLHVIISLLGSWTISKAKVAKYRISLTRYPDYYLFQHSIHVGGATIWGGLYSKGVTITFRASSYPIEGVMSHQIVSPYSRNAMCKPYFIHFSSGLYSYIIL